MGFNRLLRQMSQWISSLKLETGSASEQRKHLAVSGKGSRAEHSRAKPPGPASGPSYTHSTGPTKHVWADSDTVSQRQSLSGMDADRLVSTHTIFVKNIGT